MTQNEFLEKLRSALENDLSGSVVTENIAFYRQYIREEIEKGRGEEEIMDELGDPWVLARSIIDQVGAESSGHANEAYATGSGEQNKQDQRRQSEGAGRGILFALGIDTWWKIVLLILGVLGVLFLVFVVIGGLFSLLAPVLIPLLIVAFVVKMFRSKR